MANPGAGAKFLSVNLNKSYGQSGHTSSSSSSYGPGRGRPGGYSGGGGGGMVVLSRPRSSHKATPKLSVPPPVNLPSLRKEHEKYDPLGSGSGSSAGIGSGNGTRAASSAMGWSKASAADNARPPSTESWDNQQQYAEGFIRNNVPTPAASLGKAGSNLSVPVQPEKTSVLRGEDFPSLSATISATSGPSHKQKNGSHNQKPEMIEELSSGYRGGSRLSSEIDMRPLGHSSHSSHPDGISANRGDNLFSRPSEQVRKQDSHLPGPLPLVRVSPRSDWADDERDTTHSFPERSRDMGFSRMEPYWDKDFDFPRSSIVPHKPAQNISDRWTRQYSAESSVGNMRDRNRGVPESSRNKVDSILSGSVSKRTFARVGDKPIVEDWGSTGFDESDPFSGSLLGIVKRKKDTTKQLDFHDPVRESFEAELERVQKLQEQERKRIVEEQERAIEMVRKEEEERHRMLREQEEHQRQMEEEARQAVSRAEEERLEEMRKAEELKMVREEEKRRMSMEEERRKQAAKQKLLELEQKIARRKAESVKVERVDENSSWEDSERAVERIRDSVPSDSVPRPFAITDRGKSDSWRRDVFENGNSSSLFPPEQINGRNFSRYNANGYTASRAYYGGVFPESQLDSFPHDSASSRFDDIVLNQGDRVYQNTELDELYSYGRPRFSSRQPRVLPPPLPSVHRASFRNDSQHSGASAYGDSSTQYNHTARSELSVSKYDNDQRQMQEDADILDLQEESGKNNVIGCDSQSSLSVSSPPHSPAHLSHDDLDDTGDLLAPAEDSEIPLSGNDSIVMDSKSGKDRMVTPLSCISTGDDDEWAIESNAEMRGQKGYDEDEDDYREEDEENDRENENADLALEFEGIHLGGKDSSATENLVLGFDQGVEVGIPSDEYERSPRIENNNESLSVAPSLTVESCTPRVIQEAETAFPDKSNNSKLSSETAVSGSQPVPVHSFSSGSAVISTTASATSQSQAEMPVKLQFGLFSGPSLIPSPIPAIQIGSIQMPLQLPHQMGTSLTHMHPPQPTLFQFGQISYPSPISHGLLQLTPQSMTCSQPNVQASYPINQKAGGPSSAQASEDGYAHNFMKEYTFPLIVESQHHNLPKFSACPMESPKEASSAQESSSGMIRPMLESSGQSETKVSHHDTGSPLNQSLSSVGNSSRTPVHAQASGNRGRKAPFTARSHTQKLPFTTNDAFHSHSTGFQKRPRRGVQRMEFRVRQSTDKSQSYDSLNPQYITDMKSNNNGKISGTYARLDRMRQATESVNLDCDQGVSQGTNHQMKADKGNLKETPINQLETSLHVEGRLKRHITSEEDVDAPLQSGVVRIYNQPGIEAPSDEDDFIEVRSKRQMLNDRREQREKEKAKSKNKKVMRKPRSTTQAATSDARTVVKPSKSSIREAPKNMHAAGVTQNRGLLSREIVKGSNVVSQSLAPIGPPPVNPEPLAGSNAHSHTDKTAQSSTFKTVSSGVQVGPGRKFESENKLCDSIQTSLGAWDNAPINQEVMPLTQTQFDEAMKPGRVDMHQSSVEDCMKSVSELGRSTSPIIMDSSFSSSSPIKSLLAGEKIQFGAVTSPAVLPPNNNAVTNGAVTSPAVPPSTRSRPPVSEKIQFGALPSPTVLPLSTSPVTHEKNLADCEAEAEAAASAVAVAAISNDEGVGSCQGSMSNTASGVAQKQPRGEPKPEEALTVSLPADLSVETPPMALWPPLPSPHTSSNHILSPFPGAAPSPFPFYDMNPMLRGPVFAFSPHDESHKSSCSSSPSDGAWQPCHSGVDSFYGPPAGFPGPFPAAAVQAPPHMVVYNHFAPVGGRFGQVGVSYMGTYISSTKQPDWKHNPAPATSGSEGDIKNLNMASSHHNPPNVPQPQHLAPGPALLPMASPSVAMFDVSPFQSSGELPVQACWSHVPAQPVPHSMSLPQHQEDGIPPPQLRLMPIDNHSLRSARFPNPQTPPAIAEAAVIDQNAVSSTTNQNAVSRPDPSKGNMHNNNTSSGMKAQPLEQNSSGQQRQNNYRYGYGYQRGGGGGGSGAHRNGSGAEWSGRRTVFHGRNQSGNGGRGFPQPKMKQIYVAKQSSATGASTIQ